MKLDKLQATWDVLGRIDPMWAVLSEPEKLGGKWDPVEFLATGEREIAGLMEKVNERFPNLEHTRALDFGCGLGRLSRALSKYFDDVVGVDISPSMIDRAQSLNEDVAGCSWVLNGQDDLSIFRDGAFTFVHTNVVLQHMAPALAIRYIREFVRITAPNGSIVFQLPDEHANAFADRLKFKMIPFLPLVPKPFLRPLLHRHYPNAPDDVLEHLSHHSPEMHGARKKKIVALMERLGAPVEFVDEDPGGGWLNFRYFARTLDRG